MEPQNDKVSCSLALTPMAPGVEGVALDDRARWLVLWSAPLDRAMAEIAARLSVHPGRLTVHEGAGPPDDHDDIEIRGPARGFNEPQVLALVAYGLTAPQARKGLTAAARRLVDAQRRPPHPGRQGRAA